MQGQAKTQRAIALVLDTPGDSREAVLFEAIKRERAARGLSARTLPIYRLYWSSHKELLQRLTFPAGTTVALLEVDTAENPLRTLFMSREGGDVAMVAAVFTQLAGAGPGPVRPSPVLAGSALLVIYPTAGEPAEDAAVDTLKTVRARAGLNVESLPIVRKHWSDASQRAELERLGLLPSQVPQIALVRVNSGLVPSELIANRAIPAERWEEAGRSLLGATVVTQTPAPTPLPTVADPTPTPTPTPTPADMAGVAYETPLRIINVDTGGLLSLDFDADPRGDAVQCWVGPEQSNVRWQRWILERPVTTSRGDAAVLLSAYSGWAACPSQGGTLRQYQSSRAGVRLEPVGNGQYRIVIVGTGKVLDVSGALEYRGSRWKPVLVYDWNEGQNQRWVIQEDRDYFSRFGGLYASDAEYQQDLRRLEQRRAARRKERETWYWGDWQSGGALLSIKPDGLFEWRLFRGESVVGRWDIQDDGRMLLVGRVRATVFVPGQQGDLTVESLTGNPALRGTYKRH